MPCNDLRGAVPRLLPAAPGVPVTLAERVRAIVDAMPSGASVTLPVSELRQWIDAEGVAPPALPEPVEEWLTAEQVAERLGVTQRWCYDHQEALGARRLSRRCVRFSGRAIARYMARQRA